MKHDMDNNINWDERYFQACLAILSGRMANPKNTEIMTVGLKPVLRKAQIFIDLLKEQEIVRNSSSDAVK